MKYLRVLQAAAAMVIGSFSFSSAAASFAQSGIYDFRMWIQSDPISVWYSEPVDENRKLLNFEIDSDGRFYVIGTKNIGVSVEAKATPTDIYQGSDGKMYKGGDAVNSIKIPRFFLPNGFDIRYTGYFEASGTYSENIIDRYTTAVSGISDDAGGTGGIGFIGVDGLNCGTVECDAATRTFKFLSNQNAISPGSFGWLAYTTGIVDITLISYANISVPVPEASTSAMLALGLGAIGIAARRRKAS